MVAANQRPLLRYGGVLITWLIHYKSRPESTEDCYSCYTGREGPSLKMGCSCYYYYKNRKNYVFGGIDFWSLCWLVGAPPMITFFARGWGTVGQMTWCKWRRTKCRRLKSALLAKLGSMDCLLERSSRTNAYAGCGRPALNFIERPWLESVRSASKLNSKCIHMNNEMSCRTMHKCTEIYSNVQSC